MALKGWLRICILGYGYGYGFGSQTAPAVAMINGQEHLTCGSAMEEMPR